MARSAGEGKEPYAQVCFLARGRLAGESRSVDNLCAELGATKGSFYHHFAGMTEFTEALVAVWENTVSEIFTAMAAMPPLEGLARSMEMLQQWPLRADAAMRAWAWINPVVGAAVRHQEAVWERLMLSWVEQLVPDPERCRVLTHLLLAVLVGMTQLRRPPGAELIHEVSLEILRNNLGIGLLPDGTFGPVDPSA